MGTESTLSSYPAVVLLAHKDMQTWSWCRDGLLNNVRPSHIVVVCHRDLGPVVTGPHVSAIDEDTIIPGVSAQMFAASRAGWYFQQILKLGMAAKLQAKYYLVVDSDVVFLRPVSFFSQGKPLYAVGSEYHTPYFTAYRELLGREARREYSFVVHHMLFCSEIVSELLSFFPATGPWWKAIAEYVAPRPPLYSLSQFSEYETYGHFLKERHPEEFAIRILHWLNEPGCPTERRLQSIARRYDFVAFHEHMRKTIRPHHLLRSFVRHHLLPSRKQAAR